MPEAAFTFKDYLGEQVVLTKDVYGVILLKHPESKKFFDHIGETLASPEVVRRSVTDIRTRLYYRFYRDVLDGKFVVVVVKRAEGNFISTIYATDKIKEGEVIWQK